MFGIKHTVRPYVRILDIVGPKHNTVMKKKEKKEKIRNLVVDVCEKLKKSIHRSELLEKTLNLYFNTDMPKKDGCATVSSDCMLLGTPIILFDAINELWCEAMDDDIDDSWLSWFVFEDDFGDKKFEASYKKDMEPFVIDSIEAFAEFISEMRVDQK